MDILILQCYERLGEHEKAIAAAKRLPNLYKTRETALAMLSKNEERHINALEALPVYCFASTFGVG